MNPRVTDKARIKILLSAVVLLLSVLLLISCNPGGGTDNPASDTPAASTESPRLVLSDGTESAFTVVYPDEGTAAEREAALNIAKAIKNASGGTVATRSDLLMPGTSHDGAAYEILVGSVNYTESATAAAALKPGDYRVTVTGSKLVVCAKGDMAVTAAAAALGTALVTDTASGDVSVDRLLDLSGTAIPYVGSVPEPENCSFRNVYATGDDTYMLHYTGADAAVCDAYISTLTAAGYTTTAENSIGDSRFYTMTGSGYTLDIGYTAYNRYLRVSVAHKNTVLPRESAGAAVCTPQLTMIGLAYDTKNNGTLYGNGLSLVVRLTDGRFIIVDGGGKNDTHAKLVYDTLAAQAPDGKGIVIAAWILTHAHIDHVGVLHMFTSLYRDRVSIENLIYNFPPNEYYNALAPDSDSDNTGMAKDIRYDVTLFTGTNIVKAHTGHVYSFAGATLEILFSPDALYPAFKDTTSNSTSLIFALTLGGTRVLVTGDANSVSCAEAAKLCGTYLKSDIVTVAHHGYNGGTTQLYTLVNPETVLWPSSAEVYNNTVERDYNKYLLHSLNVKKVFVAADGIHVIPLG